MKLPKSITIKGSKYKIKIQKDELIDPTDGKPCRGLTLFDEKVIFLERSDIPEMFQTLTHEIIHIIINEIHVSLDEELEETLCEGISTEFLKVFKISVD
jgi:hypothetical protein